MKPDALVFIHGFGGFGDIWSWQTEEFLRDFQCLCVDLPGHGSSSWNHETLNDMADGVAGRIRALAADRVHVVASSFGGLVALKCWERNPSSFGGMTFVGSIPKFTAALGYPAGLDVQKVRKLASQFEGDVGGVLDMFFRSLFTRRERESEQYDKIKALRRQAALPRREALLAVLDMLEAEDLRGLLTRIDLPVQFIFGDEDFICPLSVVDALHVMKPEARVQIMKGCGHFPFLSRPQEFNDCLRSVWL